MSDSTVHAWVPLTCIGTLWYRCLRVEIIAAVKSPFPLLLGKSLPFDIPLSLCYLGCNGDVVEKAVAHCKISVCMMPWRPEVASEVKVSLIVSVNMSARYHLWHLWHNCLVGLNTATNAVTSVTSIIVLATKISVAVRLYSNIITRQ